MENTRFEPRGRSSSCTDMQETPKEYLSLRQTSAGVNCSFYGEGQNTSSGGARSCYTKIRFNPQNFTVDIDDPAFATSSGTYRSGPQEYMYVPYATAADCAALGSSTGRANVNLRGAPFGVQAGQFETTGYHPAGTANVDPTGRTASLTGGGYCGGTAPRDGILRLVWIGP